MSELVVGSIAGLAANSYVVDVSAGSTLDLTNATSLPSSALPAGSVLQVVSTTKTDTFSASLTAGQETDITGMSVSITPSSTSNKILVIFTAHLSHSYAYGKGAVMLKRDSTKIAIGDASSSRNRGTSYGAATLNENNDMVVLSMNYLDSPSTTSAITYSLGTLNPNNGTNTVYLNRTANDFDGYQVSRTVSTITVMEIAG